MAVPPRLIRRRIRSVQNTKKITKAMELVAAAKMRRAVAAALKTRAYANLAWRMIGSLEGAAGEDIHPLLRSSRKESPYKISGRGENMVTGDRGVLYIVMASDRGLCGGFNAALFRELVREVWENGTRYPPEKVPGTIFIAVGRKSEQFIRRMGWNLIASFTNIAVAPTIAELRPVAKIAIEAFTQNEVGDVRIAFTDFISSLRQQPRVKRLLPLQRIEEVGVGSLLAHSDTRTLETPLEFLFEPDPRQVLDQMLPRLTELQIYQAYLETGASEHSARMLAMRNASDAAVEMVDDLTLTLNQARQSLITREIAEISAGRAALTS